MLGKPSCSRSSKRRARRIGRALRLGYAALVHTSEPAARTLLHTAQVVRRDLPLSVGDEDAYESLPVGCDPGAIHRVRIFLLIHRDALAQLNFRQPQTTYQTALSCSLNRPE